MRVFTAKDYFRMYRARGLGFCFSYFLQVHLFDLLHGTDTHTRNDVNDYSEKPAGFDHGVWYVCSRTDVIREAFRVVRNHTGDDFTQYQFFDLGAGKGKSLLIYAQMFAAIAKYPAIGIEYYGPLMETCNQNVQKMGYKGKIEGYVDDARKVRSHAKSDKILLYLYNPFDWQVLGDVLKELASAETIIIYVDPACTEQLIGQGYSIISKKTGMLPNQCVTIFKRNI
jgi:hypothetical protein